MLNEPERWVDLLLRQVALRNTRSARHSKALHAYRCTKDEEDVRIRFRRCPNVAELPANTFIDAVGLLHQIFAGGTRSARAHVESNSIVDERERKEKEKANDDDEDVGRVNGHSGKR